MSPHFNKNAARCFFNHVDTQHSLRYALCYDGCIWIMVTKTVIFGNGITLYRRAYAGFGMKPACVQCFVVMSDWSLLCIRCMCQPTDAPRRRAHWYLGSHTSPRRIRGIFEARMANTSSNEAATTVSTGSSVRTMSACKYTIPHAICFLTPTESFRIKGLRATL